MVVMSKSSDSDRAEPLGALQLKLIAEKVIIDLVHQNKNNNLGNNISLPLSLKSTIQIKTPTIVMRMMNSNAVKIMMRI